MVMSSYLPLLKDLTVISVSFFHQVQDRRQMLGSISHLLQNSRKCIQTQIRHIKSKCENVSVFLLCAFVDAPIFCRSPLSNSQHHLQSLLPQVLSGLLQLWHRQDPADFECMYSLDFKVEYEYYPHSLLESDGFTVAIVPQPFN